MADSFWDRKTTFWEEEEEEEEPKGSRPVAKAKTGSGESRRARRVRALSRRSKVATVCALASSTALLVVLLNGLVSSDVARDADGGRATRGSDGVHARSRARVPTLGPLFDAVPVASVTDAPLGSVSPVAAPTPRAAAPSQAPLGTGGNGTAAPSAASGSTPASQSASAPAAAPASTPSLPATTTPPLATQPPSCTIGLLGTCVLDSDGGLLP